jgi:antitoxin component YwqK of YwqJK toxin-antitoxin module
MYASHTKYLKSLLFFFILLIKINSFACDTTQTVKCKTFFNNGALKTIATYKNGLRHGTWIVKNEKGLIVLKTKYKKGQRIWQFTYQNNKVIQSIDRKGRVKIVNDCGC